MLLQQGTEQPVPYSDRFLGTRLLKASRRRNRMGLLISQWSKLWQCIYALKLDCFVSLDCYI